MDDIECAFNAARSYENSQLGTSIPMLTLPDQGARDEMGDGEKALWPTTGIIPLTVTFRDQSTGHISTYLWDFGDQNTGAEPNPRHTYTSSGTFSVRLTVSGPEGSDSKTIIDFIQVHNPKKNAFPWVPLLLLAE